MAHDGGDLVGRVLEHDVRIVQHQMAAAGEMGQAVAAPAELRIAKNPEE